MTICWGFHYASSAQKMLPFVCYDRLCVYIRRTSYFCPVLNPHVIIISWYMRLGKTWAIFGGMRQREAVALASSVGMHFVTVTVSWCPPVWGDCTDIVTLWRQEHSSTAQIGANLGYCYLLIILNYDWCKWYFSVRNNSCLITLTSHCLSSFLCYQRHLSNTTT